MKYIIATMMVLNSFSGSIASCNNQDRTRVQNNDKNLNLDKKMKITIGATVFKATLYDNPTASALKTILPLTINMSELNGNEKYFQFSNSLPTNAIPNINIENGDLMLYRDNYLVVFYKSFNATYSYTRLGKIDNPTGLAAALGKGAIVVKFELE
ncbi:MAG: hypothetical protein K2P85_01360 [Flavobacteriaceae bacterium]|nr:hypothetical protein [Flavobacteriaceae bacterium]